MDTKKDYQSYVRDWDEATAGCKPATLVVHPKSTGMYDPYNATGPPMYQTATFGQPSATEPGEYDYTRSGNPTRTLLEEHVAKLEKADRALAFASGMAALSNILRVVPSGGHVVAGDDLYGGTSRLLSRVAPELGIEVSNVDTTDIEALRAAIRPGQTKLVLLESPTNPRLQVCDLEACIRVAKEAGAVTCVDNSMMPILFCRPLDLGADISMTSVTKFIGGHSDITGGILAVRGKALADKMYFHQNAEGAIMAPFECWLALRGIRTMAVRMERQAYNADRLARYLASHPLVERVNYPGLATHRGHAVHMRQASVGGCLLSFTTGSLQASKAIVESARLFKVTVSFGSVTSQISLPCFMSHASIPAEVRKARGLPDDLVRISAGVEDVDDLIADLDQAMQRGMAAAGMDPKSHIAAGSEGDVVGQREWLLQQKVRQLEEKLAAAEMGSRANGAPAPQHS